MVEPTTPTTPAAPTVDLPLTPEQAVALAKTEFWKDMNARDIVLFQFKAECLCMPFDVFHGALEKALGRPVWTHELARNAEGIMRELQDGQPPPSFEAILRLIPPEKRLIVAVGTERG